MSKKISVISMLVKDREHTAPAINKILTEHRASIIGRTGIPRPDRGINLISVFVDAEESEINRLTSQLQNIADVDVKLLMS